MPMPAWISWKMQRKSLVKHRKAMFDHQTLKNQTRKRERKKEIFWPINCLICLYKTPNQIEDIVINWWDVEFDFFVHPFIIFSRHITHEIWESGLLMLSKPFLDSKGFTTTELVVVSSFSRTPLLDRAWFYAKWLLRYANERVHTVRECLSLSCSIFFSFLPNQSACADKSCRRGLNAKFLRLE